MAALWLRLAGKLWLLMLQYQYCFGHYYHDENDVLDNNMQAVFTRQRNLWGPGKPDLAGHLYKSQEFFSSESKPFL